MKNIAIITSSLTKGGAERAAGLLSVCLNKYYNVYLFLLQNDVINYQHEGRIVNINLNKNYSKIKNKYGILGVLFCKYAYIKAVSDLRKFKKQYNIDCAISFLDTPNLMNIFSRVNEKILVSVRSTRSLQKETKIQRIENLGIKKYYNNTDKIIAISYGVAADLEKNFDIKKKKISVVYNFFDFDYIKQKASEDIDSELEKIMKNKKVILTMGRLVPAKNHLGLIDACHNLFKKIDNTILIILGSGELKQKIQKRISDLGETHRIFQIDYQENPFSIMNKSDIFIMNSEREGFCNAIIEAMACGVPVISTDCLSGPREIIGNINEYKNNISDMQVCDRGILVPTNNSIELEKAILKMMTDNSYRISCIKEASKYISVFSNEQIEKQWIEIIEEI